MTRAASTSPTAGATAPDARFAVRDTPWRLGTVIASHPVLDAYAGFVPPLLGLLQVRCDLTPLQTASLLSIGPLTSGACQPVFAWLSDRIDSRLLGGLGLAVAAVALSSIGFARDFPTLAIVFAIGMLGVGAYHPIAAASVGQLAGRRRAAGVTIFFVAGMLGATVGPIVSSRITAMPDGFDLLRWTMIPGLVVALAMHLAVRNVSHRHAEHDEIQFAPAEARMRWWAVMLLFTGNAMRFSVNIALFYLYVRFAEALVARDDPTLDAAAVAASGAVYCGQLNGLTMLGMGIGGVFTGLFVRPGREKLAFVVLPLVLAPAIAAFPLAGRLGGVGLALLAGIGYAAVIPLAISVAQKLLPHRTSLASSLMMGGAWTIAAIAPIAAERSLERVGLAGTFALTAGLLVASGLVGLLLPGKQLRTLE